MLTPVQLTTLRADITNSPDPLVIAARGNGADIGRDDTTLAKLYNLPGTARVWVTAITKDEVYGNGFNWVAIDDVAEPKWRVWTELFSSGTMNPSKANVRAGIIEVWKGNAAKLAVQEYVLNKCKRFAKRAEQLYIVGTGTEISPATLVFEGGVTIDDISLAFQN